MWSDAPADDGGNKMADAAAVVARVARVRDRLVADAVAGLPEHLLYERGRPVDELHDGIRGLSELVLRALAESRILTPDELGAVQDVGQRQVDIGVPVSVMVEAVRHSMRVLYSYVAEAAGQAPVGEQAVAVLGALSMTLVDIRQQLTEAVRSSYGGSSASSPAQARALFLHQLLNGLDSSEEELVGLVDSLGCYLGPPCGLLILAPMDPGNAAQLTHGVRAFTAALAAAVPAPRRAAPTLHVTCLVPARSASSWASSCSVADGVARANRLMVLAAEPVGRFAAMAESYREARACLAAARETAGKEARLVSMDELALTRLFGAIPAAQRLAFLRGTLGPVLALRPEQAQPLLDTLAVLEACDGRVLDAAQRLGLHAKGLRYRLRKVGALTGLSPDIPAERLRLDVALKLFRLGGCPPCGDPTWSDGNPGVPWDTKKLRTLGDGASTG